MKKTPGLLLVLLALVNAAWSAGAAGTVSLENKAIRLVVNDTDDGRGRFAVDVTGGDPLRVTDDGQPLIYGRPIPWTSFTTIRLDGRDYAFGGATARRAGKGLPIGEEITRPGARAGAIVTAWRYGDLEVTQHLSIVDGPTTGVADTARIAYTLVNRGTVPHRAGLRVCLDAMLGSNDGAPFRLGERQIMSDTSLRGTAVEPYWQAFDSLVDPRVIAQGTIAGGELTPPDWITFTNWGALADAPWEPALIPGRDFTRLGEFELDSAVALLWQEAALPPGGTLTRITYYGLGGVTIAQGQLALGLTAPASVVAGRGNTFMVLGYLENRGEGVAQDAVLTLELPASLRSVSPLRVELGRLKPKESRQVAWTVEAVGGGTTRIKVTAEAFRLPLIAVEREIRLVAPAQLTIEMLEPPKIDVSSGRYTPYPVPLTAVITNRGGETVTNVRAQFAPGAGLALAPGDGTERLLGKLEPGEKIKVTWSVIRGGAAARTTNYTITTVGRECPPAKGTGTVTWPDLNRCLQVQTIQLSSPGWYEINLSLLNLPEVARISLRIGLPAGFRLLGVKRGRFLVENGIALPWASPLKLNGGNLVLKAERSTALGLPLESLATIWLIGPPGVIPQVPISEINLYDKSGRQLPPPTLKGTWGLGP